MLDALLDGNAWQAIAAALSLLLAGALEAALVRRGVAWFYRLAMPLDTDLPPLLRAPQRAGRGRGLAWRPGPEGQLLFWSLGPPRGLHGVVRLAPDRFGRVHLAVRWAPWWTSLVAVAWLAVAGAAHGELRLTTPIAVALGGSLLIAYARAAAVTAANLRQALVEALEREPSSRS